MAKSPCYIRSMSASEEIRTMHKDQLETDLRSLKDSVAKIIQKLEHDKSQNHSPEISSIIESLVNLQREVVRIGAHQELSI